MPSKLHKVKTGVMLDEKSIWIKISPVNPLKVNVSLVVFDKESLNKLTYFLSDADGLFLVSWTHLCQKDANAI